jgi:hypothetical protein
LQLKHQALEKEMKEVVDTILMQSQPTLDAKRIERSDSPLNIGSADKLKEETKDSDQVEDSEVKSAAQEVPK